jgi:hypothetical protein
MAKPTTTGLGGTGIKAAVRDLFAVYAGIKAVKNTNGDTIPFTPDDGSLAVLAADANEIAAALDIEGAACSTSTPLAANGVFTSGIFLTQGFARIIGSVFANQAGTLKIEQSADGANFDAANTVAVTASTQTPFSIEIVAPFARITYTNGATLQTTFRLFPFLRRI